MIFIKRVFLIVLDSFGIGEMPDAHEYGDENSNTLQACVNAGAKLKTLVSMGFGNIDGVTCLEKTASPTAAVARMEEKSKGKDTTIGHWEIAGVVSNNPLPVFPNGFPKEILDKLTEKTGRAILCNKPYSGTDVIRDFGKEHLETGALIVYTSADSVLQIAAHEDKIPVPELYEICQYARDILVGEYAVGRVIARPFTGEYPFTRTTNRHDYSVSPPRKTMLDALAEAKKDVIGVGKIYDIFNGSGVTEKILTKGNTDGMAKTRELLQRDFNGLCFVNLVDFDMLYGHRNDSEGYAKALDEFDGWLAENISLLNDDDLLIITADHGCDPASPGTDHSREHVAMVAFAKGITPVNLGTRTTFADISATILDAINVECFTDGKSFYNELFS